MVLVGGRQWLAAMVTTVLDDAHLLPFPVAGFAFEGGCFAVAHLKDECVVCGAVAEVKGRQGKGDEG